jgi:hypothetical protein
MVIRRFRVMASKVFDIPQVFNSYVFELIEMG